MLNIKLVGQDIIEKNHELNGSDISKYYFIEESAELIKELTKSMRGKENRAELIKELSDVYYTLSMLVQEYSVTDEEINKNIRFKEDRARKEMGMI